MNILAETDTDERFDVQAALEVAATQEGVGSVLNDHYFLDEYVKRRGSFLEIHHDHKTRDTGLLAIARDDAQLIFTSEHEILSVQEVRRRELLSEVVPFLPLPTTANTRTIDNFKGYPRREWTPNMTPPPQEPDVQPRSHDELDQDVDSPAAGLLSRPGAEVVVEVSTQLANMTKTTQQCQQTTENTEPNEVPSLQSHLPNSIYSDANMAYGSSDQAHPPYAQNGSHIAEALPQLIVNNTQADPRLIRRIYNALGTGPTAPGARADSGDREATSSYTSPCPPLVNVDEGISSLSGRGINVPVKRGKKRAATPTPEPPTESDDQATKQPNEIAPRPTKKPQALKVPRKPLHAAPPTDTRPSTTIHQKSATSTSNANNYEAVIAGKALPKSRAEAKTAADDCHQRLLTAHNQARKARKKGADKHPDLPPEFFSTQNFPAGEESDNQVRCVCGVKVDDGASMISCDTCAVWQHTACIGEGLHKKNTQNARYDCQVCDPWVHRELVARLRREHPLGG